MTEEGGDPRAIATGRDLFQKSDADALGAIVGDVLAANPQTVAEYRAGKVASLQFLIGQGMKASKGSANPNVLKTLFEEKLK
jgi:aspartyl-tRNA(Asn)/glutamyl-tRNA(Gln) amidotransferase subunit B